MKLGKTRNHSTASRDSSTEDEGRWVSIGFLLIKIYLINYNELLKYIYRSLISETDAGGITSGQETQNDQMDHSADQLSLAESIVSGASSDVEEGTNIDGKNKR